jgi:hypothetical protein
MDELERQRRYAAQVGLVQIAGLLAELQAARQELAELREGSEAAVQDALRRQARELCRWIEHSDPSGLELGALLALVPEGWQLGAGLAPPGADYGGPYRATWTRGEDGRAGWGGSLEAAIRAATEQLLGLEPTRRSCETCRHWGPVSDSLAGARPCLRDPDRHRRTGDSSCPEGWEPAAERIGAGVMRAGNVIRSEGDS